ncbi:ABC transporter permease [Cytophagales bacterium WSM2-2]|nr:ABC transporter permease [Cytophagales bacterium WSM2-2]
MLKNYFTTGLRSLLKQKGFSLINVIGLAFGMTACLVIYLYVQEDLSYDRFNKNYDRIARLLTIDNAEGVSSKLVGVTTPPLGPAAEAELPEVIKSVRINGGGRLDLSYENNLLKCDAGFRTESSLFEIFDFKILQGKKEGVLDEPNSIAITQTLAKRIFGDADPIGKTIKLNQTTELHVVALVEDPPKSSHIQFDLLRSMTPAQSENGFRQFLQSWQGISMFTYVLLDRPLNQQDLNSKLKAIATKNNATAFFTPVAQPLSDVHLRSKEILFETNANKSDVLNVYVLSTVAILIMILAAVNFMNMVTAKSTNRAKEVGLRKVIGAHRAQLIAQHLVESLVIVFIAGAVALTSTFLLVPLLNSTYQRFADFYGLLQLQNVTLVVGLIVVVGLLAGIYPAFVLSSFKPVLVLKGAFKNSVEGIRLRKVLVVLQFTISIALMVGTGIVYQQMHFIYTADLGYNRDQVITLALNGPNANKATTLKAELLRNPNVVSVGTSSNRLGQQLGRTGIIPEGFSNQANIITSIMTADDSFIPAMGMTMKEGRNFSLQYNDSLNMIINEEMARLLKWKDAIGRKISLQTGPNPTDLTAYTVVGVVKDFHFATIRHKLEPMFMLYNKNNNAMALKVKAEGMKETLAFMEETWKKVLPGATFEHAFLDEQFANLYRNEQAFSKMFSHFTILAIIIASLGLFALSAFTAEQRKKEIAIRKVMGAGQVTIFYKLSAEFIMLISISFVLASVGAYFVMNRWLSDFQYSIKIRAGIFLVAGAASLLIAMLTISFQALKATWMNPVESLRSE